MLAPTTCPSREHCRLMAIRPRLLAWSGRAALARPLTASRRHLLQARDGVSRASSRLSRRGKPVRRTPGHQVLEPAQRRTLEIGSYVLLSGFGLGIQFGSWPVWSLLVAAGVYTGWVVLYAEITLQTIALDSRRRTKASASRTTPQPGEEHSRP